MGTSQTDKEATPWFWRRIGWRWVIAFGAIATLHLNVVTWVASVWGPSHWVTYLALAALPLIVLIAYPPARRSALHRWFTVWVLAGLADPAAASLILMWGEAWAMYRLFVVEHPPARIANPTPKPSRK